MPSITRPDLVDLDRVRGAMARGRPVVLTTLGVPLDPDAAVFAVDTAVELGQPLVVANVTKLEPLPLSVRMGYDALEEYTPEVSASVRRTVELAASLGIKVERLRIRSPRPLQAIIALLEERAPGVLVFGPDRGAVSGRRYRRALAFLLGRAPCLVWAP